MLASAIMNQAASVYLNDAARSLYSYTVQLPMLMAANQELEQLLLQYNAQQPKVKSSVINVDAAATEITITTLTDFLLPMNIWERERSSTNEDAWSLMTEKEVEPNAIAVVGLTIWSFRNNKIYIVPSSSNREVKIEYQRMQLVLDASSDTVDFYLSNNYLASKTAELCARYIGMNGTVADSIRDNEFLKHEDKLTNILILNQQGNVARRRPFNSHR